MSEVVRIPLSQGFEAVIDAADAGLVAGFKWSAKTRPDSDLVYASRTHYSHGKQASVLLHRVIMDPPKRMVVDHINGDTLDNRRCNLRICTPTENFQNSRGKSVDKRSSFKGVWFCGIERRWRARINAGGRRVQLGRFSTDVEAARAYDEAAKKYHGEFARTNADMGLYAA